MYKRQAIYTSKIIDLSPDSMVFELTGRPEKINAFLKMFSGYEILELCRTGITALERGGKHPHMQKPPQEVRAAQLPDVYKRQPYCLARSSRISSNRTLSGRWKVTVRPNRAERLINSWRRCV